MFSAGLQVILPDYLQEKFVQSALSYIMCNGEGEYVCHSNQCTCQCADEFPQCNCPTTDLQIMENTLRGMAESWAAAYKDFENSGNFGRSSCPAFLVIVPNDSLKVSQLIWFFRIYSSVLYSILGGSKWIPISYVLISNLLSGFLGGFFSPTICEPPDLGAGMPHVNAAQPISNKAAMNYSQAVMPSVREDSLLATVNFSLSAQIHGAQRDQKAQTGYTFYSTAKETLLLRGPFSKQMMSLAFYTPHAVYHHSARFQRNFKHSQ